MRPQHLYRYPGFFRKRLEKIFNVRIDGLDNHVDKHIYGQKKLQIDIFGNNNTVEVDERTHNLKLALHIYGHNNHVSIGRSGGTLRLEIGSPIYAPSEDILVAVGDDTWLGQVDALAVENCTRLTIGDGCAFANVTLWASDTHAI